jgi:hypothetical protein
MTTVWSYGSIKQRSTIKYPAFTIEAKVDRPVRVQWVNNLVNGSNNLLPHLLPVDPTLHWATPRGGADGRDMRPEFLKDALPVYWPGADRDTPARRAQHGGKRRLGQGLVPPRREPYPLRLRDGLLLLRRVHGQVREHARSHVGSGHRRVPVRQRPARVHTVVPRPHAGDDPPERLCRPCRFLSPSRRALGPPHGRASVAGSEARRPTRHEVL